MQGSVRNKPHCGMQVQPRLLAEVHQVPWARLSQRPRREEFLHLASLQKIEALKHIHTDTLLFTNLFSCFCFYSFLSLPKYNLVTLPWPPVPPGLLSEVCVPRGQPPSQPPRFWTRSGPPSRCVSRSRGYRRSCAQVPGLLCLSSED